jgi:hypothetical protein
VVRIERRDHQERANTVRRVLIWMRSERSPVAGVPRHLASPDAGMRILKQLAMRGLIRSTREGWVAQPFLRHPPPLTKLNES